MVRLPTIVLFKVSLSIVNCNNCKCLVSQKVLCLYDEFSTGVTSRHTHWKYMNGLSLSLPNILTIPKGAQLFLFCFTVYKNCIFIENSRSVNAIRSYSDIIRSHCCIRFPVYNSGHHETTCYGCNTIKLLTADGLLNFPI